MIVEAAAQPNVSRARPPEAVVELREITKRFGPVVANDGISLEVRRGEILALLGENGAGKTTLLNLLSGVHQPDSGEIQVHDCPVRLGSPEQALKLGIGAVYQHFALVPSLTVQENMLLGTGGWFFRRRSGNATRVRAHLDELGFQAPLGARVRYLSMGERQRLEIAKALFRATDVLLLDEPTAVLTPSEVDALFSVLHRLRDRGVAVVLITHKLAEALAVADRVAVLRAGRKVGELDVADSDRESEDLRERIVGLMFGQDAPPLVGVQAGATLGPVFELLSARNLDVRSDRGGVAVNGLSLDLRAGEIFGIAGVDGNGQAELAEALAGQRQLAGGAIRLTRNARDRDCAGSDVAYVTDDRLGEGIVASMTVADNLVLKSIDRPPFSRHGRLDRAAIRTYATRLIAEFDIRAPGPNARAGTLSGGNVQKLLLARELAADPNVLICKNPTHGLDARTARFVLEALRRHADRGRAVLLLSSELDDLLAVADRIGVLYRGRLVGVARREDVVAESLGRWMVGTARELEVGAA